MTTRTWQWMHTLVAAALAASTGSVATAALVAGSDAFASGLLFMGVGTLVSLAACGVAMRGSQ
jgi:uncharacterized membrane protein